VLGIFQQAADVDPGVGVEQIEQLGAVRLLYLTEGIGEAVGRHASKQFCGCFPRHQGDEFWLAFQPWLVENFNGAIGRQVKQNRDRKFRRHVVKGFDDVSRALFDHACGEERRIGHVVGLRHGILDVKIGHDSHLRADDGRISLPIYPDKQTVSNPLSFRKIAKKQHGRTIRYLVRGGKQRRSGIDAERVGGLEVDDELAALRAAGFALVSSDRHSTT
jgi:hypothetical protein